MANLPDLEARLAAVEARLEEVAADAAAARHLAAARDRDLSDLTAKLDANRRVINALGDQTAGRFDQLDQRIDRLEAETRNGFAEMRGKLDQTAAGQELIVGLCAAGARAAAGGSGLALHVPALPALSGGCAAQPTHCTIRTSTRRWSSRMR